jgi:hypothetical protein
MWPREVFDATVQTDSGRKTPVARTLENLKQPGVYILYRDDIPYYVGQAKRLRGRLWRHAMNPNSRLYNFWNFFSAFVVLDQKRRDEIEAILIAAMRNANSAKPKMERDKLPKNVARLLRDIRRYRTQISELRP